MFCVEDEFIEYFDLKCGLTINNPTVTIKWNTENFIIHYRINNRSVNCVLRLLQELNVNR